MKKILFVHIPKTGGMSTHRYLVDNHATFPNHTYEDGDWGAGYFCHRFLKYEIGKYRDHFKFSIIRNPNDRFVSMFTYVGQQLRLGVELWDGLPDEIRQS